jgi:DNA-binding LytR/AlgR family response regulator
MGYIHRIVIIEDEPLAAERLMKMVQKLDVAIEISAILDSVSASLNWFSVNPQPDLVLSDIQLGDGISFQIFENQLVACPIIFTTSYDEYAIRAFKLQSLDYLLKPVKPEELQAAWDKFLKIKAQSQAPWEQMQTKIREVMQEMQIPKWPTYKERFLVRQADQIIPVAVEEIAYFFTLNDWVCIQTHESKQFIVDYRLDELESLLHPGKFFRLNRQFIAALASIRKAHHHLNGKLKIDLSPPGKEEIFVSREKAAAFRTWWEG